MSWIVLVVSGALEAVWATALAESQGFRRRVPTLVFIVSMALSMAGLAFAMAELPPGTAYAVWVGIGATLTAAWSMVRGDDPVTTARLLLLLLLVGSVIGLKLVS